jgi:hypothetical protein
MTTEQSIKIELDQTEWLEPVSFGKAPGKKLQAFTWPNAMREIESILSWIITNKDRYVTFDITSRKNRYVQARATDDGRIFIETTGDKFTINDPYTVNDLIHLVRLGWCPTGTGEVTPNWWREADPRWFYAQPMMAELLVRTIIDIHKASNPSDIKIKVGTF